MGLASKIVGYFFGILIVLFGIIWIMSTIPISVIVVGLIGLIAIIVGISIMYLGHRSGENKKEQELQTIINQ
jgi:cadmium resistance protein CadD (predicted permease)